MRSTIFGLLMVCASMALSGYRDEKFVTPDNPLVVSQAPSDQVENGNTFESGSIRLDDGSTLVLPESVVVEEYAGSTVRFFLTKSVRFAGHPPHPMPIARWRECLGIALKKTDGEHVISNFGEWSNKEGSARLRLLVLVPKGQKVERQKGLEGKNSQASSSIDFGSPAMKECYWYSGMGPEKGWEPIVTELNYNRFLQPG